MKSFLAILLLLLLFACKLKDDSGEPNEYAAEFVKKLNLSDSFLYEIPTYNLQKYDTIMLKEHKSFEESLSLPSLDKGFDSVMIRIHFGGFAESSKIIVLKNTQKKWYAECILYESFFNENNQLFEYSVIKKTSAYPKSGWITLINKLFDLKILSIEDPHKVPGFQFGRATDGWGIDVEIATKRVYRWYGYGNPDIYPEFWQAKNMVVIRDLLYHEFKILRDWDKDKEKKDQMLRRVKESKSKPIEVNELIINDIPDTAIRLQKNN